MGEQELKCWHIYKYTDQDYCSTCGNWTNRVDWKLQNKLNKEWIKKNPFTGSGVWWSI